MTAEGPLVHLREHRDIIDVDLGLISSHRPAGRLLDVGAGRGWFVTGARGRGLDAVALDLESKATAVWRADGVPGVIADGSRTPFVPASFDIVRMKEVISTCRTRWRS